MLLKAIGRFQASSNRLTNYTVKYVISIIFSCFRLEATNGNNFKIKKNFDETRDAPFDKIDRTVNNISWYSERWNVDHPGLVRKTTR